MFKLCMLIVCKVQQIKFCGICYLTKQIIFNGVRWTLILLI